MVKKRRTRKQQKKQRQARKGKLWQRRPLSRMVVLPPIGLDQTDIEAIAPLMTGSDAQSTQNMVNTLYDSGQWADEPELADILFEPEMSLGFFIKTAEEMGYSADTFFDLKGAAREDAFFDIMTVALPVLMTEEGRQEILDGLAALAQRYQSRSQRRKVAQATFVRLLLTNEEQKTIWPQIALLQAIASRSVDAGFKLVGLIEEIKESGEDLFDESGNLMTTANVSHLEKLMERIPGINRVLYRKIDQLWKESGDAAFAGTLNLGLYTSAELEQVDAIMVKHLEPGRAAGQAGLADEIVPAMINEVDNYLVQLLTPERLVQMQQRLGSVIREKRLEPKWLGLASMLRHGLGEADAAESERPFLLRVLMGELRSASQDEEE